MSNNREATVFGAGVLRRVERLFLALDERIGRGDDDRLNPLQQTGAIAMLSFVVATLSGVPLLIWYEASLTGAYASAEAMGEQWYLAGLLRSLHRYSSDTAMLFTLLHALRLLVERRFTGTRWWAWLTGVASVVILWTIGWTGYWLVWDERGVAVARSTAALLDELPIIIDPLSRALLADEAVNSLLFFVVFFFHMLIPVGLVVTLWLHIARLSRPTWLPDRRLTAIVLGAMVVMSLVWPADLAESARLASLASSYSFDAWYLAPVALAERMSGRALWLVVIAGTVAVASLPWSLRARPTQAPAAVEPSRCNACRKCYTDCPYDAISMVPRTDSHPRYPEQAQVDPAKCVSCGICAGSCDSAGVGVPWFDVLEQRRVLDAWLAEDAAAGRRPYIGFVCAESAGGELAIDSQTGLCTALPDWRFVELPCAGWLHMLTIERAIRRGAAGVLVVSCHEGSCRYREGAKWTRERFGGKREPSLRTIPGDAPTELVPLDWTEGEALMDVARRISGRSVTPAAAGSPPSRLGSVVAGLVLFVLVLAGSRAPYASPDLAQGSQLTVSIKTSGSASEQCRTLSEEEVALQPIHMRKTEECERRRSDVRLQVSIDGETVADTTIRPTGLWRDGNSIDVQRFGVAPGLHNVVVRIANDESGTWAHEQEQDLEFFVGEHRVVTFGTVEGFAWH